MPAAGRHDAAQLAADCRARATATGCPGRMVRSTCRTWSAARPTSFRCLALLAGASDADGDQLRVLGLKATSGTLAPVEGGWMYMAERGDPREVVFSFAIGDGIGSVEQLAHLRIVDPPPIVGTDGDDNLLGTTCGEVIDARDGHDNIDARQGNDIVLAGNGDDHVVAGDGNDVVQAGAGNDIVFAGPGNDVVFGGGGDDRLFGEAGDDTIFGEEGNDAISGGSGDDILLAGIGDDVVHGDAGNDCSMAVRATTPCTAMLATTGARWRQTSLAGDGDDTLLAGPMRGYADVASIWR